MSLASPISLYRAVHRTLAPVSRAYRALAFRKGRDATEEFARRSSLVLAPHPDDETLGCAATIMHKRNAGSSVKIAIATDGQIDPPSRVVGREERVAMRRSEALEASGLLGVEDKDLEFLGFTNRALHRELGPVRERILTMFEEHRPDDLLVTAGGDRHPDHYALSTAVRSLMLDGALDCIVYEYPIWYWRVYPWTHRPANLASGMWHFVRDPIAELFREAPSLVRTDGLLDRKRDAIASYRSQIKNPHDEPDWWTFPDGFVESFLGPHEIFFRVRRP